MRGRLRQCAAAAADRLAHRHGDRRRQIRRAARRHRRHPRGRAFRARRTRAAVRHRRAGLRRRGGLALSRHLTSSSACAGVFERDALATGRRDGRHARRRAPAYGKNPDDIAAAAYRPERCRGLCRGPYRAGAGAGGQGPAARHRHRHRRPEPAPRHGDRRGRPRRHGADECCGATRLPARPRWRWRWRSIAREHPEDGMVGTVGRIEAVPGAVNIIPGRVLFTVDLRSLTDSAAREGRSQRFEAEARAHRRSARPRPSRSSRSTRLPPRIARRRCRKRWPPASPRWAIRRSGCHPARATTRR